MARSNASMQDQSPPPPVSVSCGGVTKKGNACGKSVLDHSGFCHYHRDQAHEVKKAAFEDETLEDLAKAEAERRGSLEDAFEVEDPPEAEEEFSAEEKQSLYQAIWSKVKILTKKMSKLVGEDLTDYAQGIWYLAQNQLQTMSPLESLNPHQTMQGLLESDLLDPDFWEGLWYVLRYSVEAKVDAFGRYRRGEYEVDDFGMDEEFLDQMRPLLNFFYNIWWRVSTHGIENVPGSGRALLAVNHSGVLPFDGAMVLASIANEHPEPRPVRNIYLRWFAAIPFLNVILARSGQVMACPENAQLLLEQDQLVSVFPEGIKGVGKLYKDRYKLARFGRGGFIRSAMRTLSPIIPVAVVGAEEIYPAIRRADWLGKPLGLPYLPITPTFPWLGLAGLIPLPSKWSIDYCKPVKFKGDAAEMSEDYLVVALLTEMIRKEIQTTLWRRLKRRRSIWY